MEKGDFYFSMVGICIFLLFTLLLAIGANERINDIENKINGNCIYVNNEFYCKD